MPTPNYSQPFIGKLETSGSFCMQHCHHHHNQILVTKEYKPLLLLDGLLFRRLWLITGRILEHKSENIQRSWHIIFKGNLNSFKIFKSGNLVYFSIFSKYSNQEIWFISSRRGSRPCLGQEHQQAARQCQLQQEADKNNSKILQNTKAKVNSHQKVIKCLLN